MAERGQFNHLFKPGQRKIAPVKSPHGSWWIDATREDFTKTAQAKVQPPMPVILKSLYPEEYR